jgi:hypothetical protein
MPRTIGNEYSPEPEEEVATGAVGVVMFVGLMILSAASILIWNIKNRTNKAFFGSVFLMALMELPRYCMMSDSGTYTSVGAYGCHVLAGIFFFLSFSCVAYQWAGILNMAGYFSVIYSPAGLFVINSVFGLLDFISASLCFSSGNLQDYFYSDFFIAVTVLETCKNLLFSVVLSYFGIKLVMRFQNYTSTSSGATSSSGIMLGGVGKKSLLNRDANRSDTGIAGMGNSDRSVDFFRKALERITAVLTIATLCFTLRIIMLIIKLIAFHDDIIVTSPAFPLFGFGWFLFSDFIPRIVPTSAFIVAMLMSHKHTEEDKAYFASQATRIASGKFTDDLDPSPEDGLRDSGDSADSGERVSDDDLNLSVGKGDADHIPSRA